MRMLFKISCAFSDRIVMDGQFMNMNTNLYKDNYTNESNCI
jgi:hypothetical protein